MTTTTTTRFSVFRSSVRWHATHAIGELKNLLDCKIKHFFVLLQENPDKYSSDTYNFLNCLRFVDADTDREIFPKNLQLKKKNCNHAAEFDKTIKYLVLPTF